MGLVAQAMEKEKNFFLRESKHGKNHGGVVNEDSLSVIQQNLDEQEKKMNELKHDIEMVNEMSTSKSMTMQLQDSRITHLMIGCYPLFTKDSPNYNMDDSKD